MSEKILFTRKDVAKFFSVTPRTIKNWEKTGKIKSQCLINSRPRYNLDEIGKIVNNEADGKP